MHENGYGLNRHDRARLASWDEMLGIGFLLAERFGECSDATDDTNSHETERDQGPDDTPALGGATVLLGEDAGVGGVDFA